MKMKRAINLYLDEEVIERLRIMADKRAKSISEFVTQMTNDFPTLMWGDAGRYLEYNANEMEKK
jgi:hypothetical protein